ncbi:hypothetical protein BET10_00210 [Pseudoalteromonas amylolytica]|uniref:Uncharacterized protein n=1 Tax=Pseudoalteromonas amylolytica TaxID=1859457 RepID=A0A1S1MT37_9GAMM|nr:hypothetical protein BFC16_01730 [Pseudoalteromonas sp. JW3]OHU87076.1 hypothetical protein BET10_00210 [Pseudoalteromonas amylolytica]
MDFLKLKNTDCFIPYISSKLNCLVLRTRVTIPILQLLFGSKRGMNMVETIFSPTTRACLPLSESMLSALGLSKIRNGNSVSCLTHFVEFGSPASFYQQSYTGHLIA